MPVYLEGVGISNYKGIGAAEQLIAPFKEFNFFIGENNSGKSTILSFLKDHIKRSEGNLNLTDRHRGATSGDFASKIALSTNDILKNCIDAISRNQNSSSVAHLAERLIRFTSDQSGLTWFNILYPLTSTFRIEIVKTSASGVIETALNEREWHLLWSRLRNSTGGDLSSIWIPDVLSWIANCQSPIIPDVKFIPAIREIGSKDSSFDDYSGRGLIDVLAKIQNPDFDKREEKKKFDAINEFLQTVTGKKNASIEIPYNRDHVIVHMDDKVLPLSSLGTGIHEVIMIASFCTLSEESIVCIEEPEIHLHPLLQKKLMQFLMEKTSNQYFIATHSASFIDTLGAAIFHVENDGSQTSIRHTEMKSARFEVCQRLGYRASDLLQSNLIIWVEGPSDRIYLNHWIKNLAPDLLEGIHYSIMFYGGRLLSHLSADEEDVQRFIDLRSINRNIVILIDSDKTSDDDAINSTKQRIADEFQDTHGMCWITRGREIENYISHEQLQKAVSQRYTNYGKPGPGGQFDHALHYQKRGNDSDEDNLVTTVDKVGVAERVCSEDANLDILDLRDRLNELVELIRRVN
ncbi:ATP-dependent nuclease [Brucella intermedia]|uniref:ATP-dependent nuclease n=1 Tax=Brucella intermedia TaxID=94625 RepID=UPI0023628365|nr:AAA family ATPase [Brucella intermedia]